MWEGDADRLLFCDCRGLLLRQHTKPKNRVEPLRTLEWPHFQFPFASSDGEFYGFVLPALQVLRRSMALLLSSSLVRTSTIATTNRRFPRPGP
jgi:hypothetical protein